MGYLMFLVLFGVLFGVASYLSATVLKNASGWIGTIIGIVIMVILFFSHVWWSYLRKGKSK